jgi:enoyl-CoA hydratase/carnithine racemase
MSCDMCFGVRGKIFVNQMEMALGILLGGTGTQRYPRLIGRNRAVEVIMGGADLDADTAERWGYLNRAFEPEQIGPYVEWLTHRVASFPAEAVRLAKQAINSADNPMAAGFRDGAYPLNTDATDRSSSGDIRTHKQIRQRANANPSSPSGLEVEAANGICEPLRIARFTRAGA